MQQTRSAATKTSMVWFCWNSTQQNPPKAAPSATPNGSRLYQRGLSKQIMKLSKYTASGSTQRNGITATSWHILFVVASSSTDAHAGSRSQRSRSMAEMGGGMGWWSEGVLDS